MRCAMCNKEMRSSFDDYESGLCARCAHQDMHSTTITFPVDDDLVYRGNRLTDKMIVKVCTPCLVCGEDVVIEPGRMVSLCDNCRKAVLYARKKMESEGE